MTGCHSNESFSNCHRRPPERNGGGALQQREPAGGGRQGRYRLSAPLVSGGDVAPEQQSSMADSRRPRAGHYIR